MFGKEIKSENAVHKFCTTGKNAYALEDEEDEYSLLIAAYEEIKNYSCSEKKSKELYEELCTHLCSRAKDNGQARCFRALILLDYLLGMNSNDIDNGLRKCRYPELISGALLNILKLHKDYEEGDFDCYLDNYYDPEGIKRREKLLKKYSKSKIKSEKYLKTLELKEKNRKLTPIENKYGKSSQKYLDKKKEIEDKYDSRREERIIDTNNVDTDWYISRRLAIGIIEKYMIVTNDYYEEKMKSIVFNKVKLNKINEKRKKKNKDKDNNNDSNNNDNKYKNANSDANTKTRAIGEYFVQTLTGVQTNKYSEITFYKHYPFRQQLFQVYTIYQSNMLNRMAFTNILYFEKRDNPLNTGIVNDVKEKENEKNTNKSDKKSKKWYFSKIILPKDPYKENVVDEEYLRKEKALKENENYYGCDMTPKPYFLYPNDPNTEQLYKLDQQVTEFCAACFATTEVFTELLNTLTKKELKYSELALQIYDRMQSLNSRAYSYIMTHELISKQALDQLWNTISLLVNTMTSYSSVVNNQLNELL